MKVIFLDIDGVLNGHEVYPDGNGGRIMSRCVRHLNSMLHQTGAKIVLSSAWRYMLLGWESFTPAKQPPGLPPAMTPRGFEYLMRTHGAVGFNLVGTTASDEAFGFPKPDDHRRAKQVLAWLESPAAVGLEEYVVVDDCDFGFTAAGMPFVKTGPLVGLTRRDAAAAIQLLNDPAKTILQNSVKSC